MNNTEIGLLAGLGVAVLTIIYLLVFHVMSSKGIEKDILGVDSMFPLSPKNLPVPKYIKATRKLPETFKPSHVYADEELRDDYPVR